MRVRSPLVGVAGLRCWPRGKARLCGHWRQRPDASVVPIAAQPRERFSGTVVFSCEEGQELWDSTDCVASTGRWRKGGMSKEGPVSALGSGLFGFLDPGDQWAGRPSQTCQTRFFSAEYIPPDPADCHKILRLRPHHSLAQRPSCILLYINLRHPTMLHILLGVDSKQRLARIIPVLQLAMPVIRTVRLGDTPRFIQRLHHLLR